MEVKTEETKTEDAFAYIEASGFSSEIFKIEIRGLPKFYGFGELKKLLNEKLKLSSNKIKGGADRGKNRTNFVFVCFRNEEDRQMAIKTLNGYSWKGYTLTAIEAKPIADPMARKRNLEDDDVDKASKKRKTVVESVTELADLPYDEQLKKKQADMRDTLQTFGNQVWKECQALRSFITDQRKLFDQLPCELETIRKAPMVDGYRNKCEFTVGKDETGEVQVGFRLGSYMKGLLEVGCPDEVKNIPERMKIVAKYYKQFLIKHSYEPFCPKTYKGQFKQLTVRYALATDELMIVAGIQAQKMEESEIKGIQEKIVDFFTNDEGKEAKVTSIYYEDLSPRQQGQKGIITVHLFGATHITDIIHGLKFRISPAAFFQVNTPGAEILYQVAIDLAKPTEKTTVLDICCGTGTIGLCFAKYCKSVLGVEIVPQAIEDADFNAKENKIENCKFHAGNSDDFISSLMRTANANPEKGEEVLAVVDPPRAGLSVKSISQLRNSKGLNRLIYVSCTPKRMNTVRNWADLVKPTTKTLHGNPFVLKKAVPVDMFPHTGHTELVLLFEREKGASVEEEKVDDKKTNDINAEKVVKEETLDTNIEKETVSETAKNGDVKIDKIDEEEDVDEEEEESYYSEESDNDIEEFLDFSEGQYQDNNYQISHYHYCNSYPEFPQYQFQQYQPPQYQFQYYQPPQYQPQQYHLQQYQPQHYQPQQFHPPNYQPTNYQPPNYQPQQYYNYPSYHPQIPPQYPYPHFQYYPALPQIPLQYNHTPAQQLVQSPRLYNPPPQTNLLNFGPSPQETTITSITINFGKASKCNSNSNLNFFS